MIQFEMFTNTGKREVNEDSISMTEKDGMYCFSLADGLGGHGKGEIASQMVVDSICKKFHSDGDSEEFLRESYSEAQKQLAHLKRQMHEKTSMMTTAVTLVVNNEEAKWAHIGDSRLYMFYRNKIVQRTIDHSVPQLLVLTGNIKEKQIRNHPDRNKLTKAFGSTKQLIDCTESNQIPLNKCQGFLLCSDGFWELIYEKEMCRALKRSKSASEWMQKMINIVAKRGINRDMDNFSAITILL